MRPTMPYEGWTLTPITLQPGTRAKRGSSVLSAASAAVLKRRRRAALPAGSRSISLETAPAPLEAAVLVESTVPPGSGGALRQPAATPSPGAIPPA
jgi:hypothetical protein